MTKNLPHPLKIQTGGRRVHAFGLSVLFTSVALFENHKLRLETAKRTCRLVILIARKAMHNIVATTVSHVSHKINHRIIHRLFGAAVK